MVFLKAMSYSTVSLIWLPFLFYQSTSVIPEEPGNIIVWKWIHNNFKLKYNLLLIIIEFFFL